VGRIFFAELFHFLTAGKGLVKSPPAEGIQATSIVLARADTEKTSNIKYLIDLKILRDI
jgi:hypothetical protein